MLDPSVGPPTPITRLNPRQYGLWKYFVDKETTICDALVPNNSGQISLRLLEPHAEDKSILGERKQDSPEALSNFRAVVFSRF